MENDKVDLYTIFAVFIFARFRQVIFSADGFVFRVFLVVQAVIVGSLWSIVCVGIMGIGGLQVRGEIWEIVVEGGEIVGGIFER